MIISEIINQRVRTIIFETNSGTEKWLISKDKLPMINQNKLKEF